MPQRPPPIDWDQLREQLCGQGQRPPLSCSSGTCWATCRGGWCRRRHCDPPPSNLGVVAQAHVGRLVGADGVGAGIGHAGDECEDLVGLRTIKEAMHTYMGQPVLESEKSEEM